jgi:hypothetical protein
MSPLAHADLVSLLQNRKLDVTLTTVRPWLADAPEQTVPTGIATLDASLGGGVPRGHLSSIAGPPSSGRTSLLVQMLAGVTAEGELAALIDARDSFDPQSATAFGLEVSRLLWIRGGPVTAAESHLAMFERQLDRAVKACSLVLQSGGFGLVVLDLADVPDRLVRALPFTTWLRLARMVEGRRTACVVLGERPIARSPGGVSIALDGRTAHWSGESEHARLFRGLQLQPRLTHARRAS